MGGDSCMQKKILWIEDAALMLGGLVRPLEKSGHQIITVQNEKEALKALDKENFDLILFDIIIPSGSDGDDYIEYVGARLADEIVNKRNLKTPIIGISVVTRPDIINNLYKLGFKKIFLKGHLRPTQLKDEVEKIFNCEART